ncbi:hypothetical protein ACTMTJ_34165 [Phytohabitans sp. LJ34]|uniref:hypothetical protein n=1 Tax=Phytohabitans sp. LJ34 TaxID=3452217 RepID=UPI003F89E7DC
MPPPVRTVTLPPLAPAVTPAPRTVPAAGPAADTRPAPMTTAGPDRARAGNAAVAASLAAVPASALPGVSGLPLTVAAPLVSQAQRTAGNGATAASLLGTTPMPPATTATGGAGSATAAASGTVPGSATAAQAGARAAKPGAGAEPAAAPKDKKPAAALGAGAPAVAEPGRGQKQVREEAAGARRRLGPDRDPKFQALKKDVGAKKRAVATSHPPARAEATNAQGAAQPPADDKEAQGKAANAEKMDAAQPKEFDKAAFIRAVEEAIAKRAPKNLDEADKFGDSDKPAEAKAEVQGRVGEGKAQSAEEIATTTAAPPDTSKAVEKTVVPLTADRPPGVPGTPHAANAVPDKLPPSATDTSDGPREINDQMAAAQVTEPQLAKSNEPRFVKALGEKKAAEREAPRAQARMRAHEAKTLAGAKADAQGTGTDAMRDITGTRVTTGRKVGAGKTGAKGRDEDKRAQVTATLQRVFDATKKDVEDILSGLDKKVDDQFTREEKDARDAFTAEHKRRMSEYKDRRYGGLTGKARWVRDLFAGLPEEANQVYVVARDNYVAEMRKVISRIADTIAGELTRAKRRIAKGRADLQAEVRRLPADLRAIGQEAAADFSEKFDDLRQSVDDKGTELVDTLAEKYTEALKSVDEEIAAEKEKNKGLVAKAVDAVKGVIDTIIELKNLLLGVLAKAGQAIMAILRDPIGFLGNLVRAVGAGLRNFIRNIRTHLQTGILSWLLGVSARAGLQLPARFDARGILLLIATLLGLSWASLRARIVRRVPVQAVVAAESAVPLVTKVKREGVGGLWDEIKARVGDLKRTLISKIIEYLVPTIIIAGITWVLSLLNPASAFVRAVKLIIDIVTFIVQRARQIIDFVNAVLDAVIAIARGAGGGAPALVERALARSIPVLIGFLAALLGIGGIADRVKKIFQTLSRPVQRAVDWAINKIIGLVKRLWAKLKRQLDRKKPKKPKKPRPDRPPRRARRRPDRKDPDRRRRRPPRREDKRSAADKLKALDAALAEVEALAGDTPSRSVIARQLGRIRRKHKLTRLYLEDRGGGEFRAVAEINPRKTSRTYPPGETKYTIIENGVRILRPKYQGAQMIRRRLYRSGDRTATQQIIKDRVTPLLRLKDRRTNSFVVAADWATATHWEAVPGTIVPLKGKTEPSVEHKPEVFRHWNSDGKNTNQSERFDWYHFKGRESTVEILQAYLNKSAGSYDKDVGPNFKEPGE